MSQPSLSAQPLSGAVVEYAAGTIILHEGEQGGDLYFIKEGAVEVYRHSGASDVQLAKLHAGEVLGIMTCLTRGPRLASARALTPVKALIVKQAGIRSLITSTPPWVHTVIKDFTVRVQNINELYLRAWQRLDELATEASDLRLAVRVTCGLAEVGTLLAGADGTVDRAAVVLKLARIFDVGNERIERVLEALVAAGLLIDGRDISRGHIDLAVLERLGAFADVVRGYLSSAERRVAFDQLSEKDRQYLKALSEHLEARNQQAGHAGPVPLSKAVLAEMPAEAAIDVLRRAAAADMVRLEASSKETLVVLVPAQVMTTLHALKVIGMLRPVDPLRSCWEDGSAAALT